MSISYDSSLLSLHFYSSHPYMLPFVGRDYDSPKHKKLLLVGESHYVPEGSIVHHNANAWYNGTPVLNQEEQDWCNTRDTREWKSGRFGKEIDRCLNLVLPTGEMAGGRWLRSIIFCVRQMTVRASKICGILMVARI